MAATANWAKHNRTRPTAPVAGDNRSRDTIKVGKDGVLYLTKSQWMAFFHLNFNNVKGELKTVGIHSTPISYWAPTVSAHFEDTPYGKFIESYTLWGWRILSGCYEGSGGCLSGYATAGNRKRAAHTSSIVVKVREDDEGGCGVVHTLESDVILLQE